MLAGVSGKLRTSDVGVDKCPQLNKRLRASFYPYYTSRHVLLTSGFAEIAELTAIELEVRGGAPRIASRREAARLPVGRRLPCRDSPHSALHITQVNGHRLCKNLLACSTGTLARIDL